MNPASNSRSKIVVKIGCRDVPDHDSSVNLGVSSADSSSDCLKNVKLDISTCSSDRTSRSSEEKLDIRIGRLLDLSSPGCPVKS